MTAFVLAPLPIVVVLALVLLAVVPWGGADWIEFALLLVPLGAIYFWSWRRPQLMPPLLVFLSGLSLDVMTHGPLGVWTCAALAVALTARFARQSRSASRLLSRMAGVAAAIGAAVFIVWLLMSASTWQAAAIWPLAQAYAAACIGYPVLAAVLSVFDAAWPVEDGRPLFLRGD